MQEAPAENKLLKCSLHPPVLAAASWCSSTVYRLPSSLVLPVLCSNLICKYKGIIENGVT